MTNTQTALIIALVVFAILFGWYGVRPASIRSSCTTSADHDTTPNQSWETLYSRCLHERGL